MVPYYDPKEAERMTTESKGYLATKEGELRALGIEVKSCVENGPVVPASWTWRSASMPT